MAGSTSHRISHFQPNSRPTLSPLGPRTRSVSRTVTPSSSATSSTHNSLLLSPMAEPAPMYSRTPSPATSNMTPSPTIESPSLSLSSSRSMSSPSLSSKLDPKPAILVPAPKISFESVPVEFKGLPLEAFLWTLDNKQLQEMVSRAIRQSARESSIRLVSLENLDNSLPREIQRLSSLKAVTQSRYRFLVHRRTMLLHALNSSSLTPEAKVPEDGVSLVNKLTQQLSGTCAECDQMLEVLLRVTDQLGQITKLLDEHWASALAIALRKLNKSYGKRTSELLVARGKVEQLEAELKEAWKEAARYAQEMDAVEVAGIGSDDEEEGVEEEEAVIETVEKIIVPLQRASTIPDLLLKSPNDTTQMNNPPISPPVSSMSETFAISVPPSESHLPKTPLHQDAFDTASIKSVRSVKSTRSMKGARSTHDSDATRLSLVSAARKRSQRTSKGSLRFLGRPKTPLHPPIPGLPLEFTRDSFPSVSSLASSPYDKRIKSSSSAAISRLRRKSLCFPGPSPRQPLVWSTMDDINLRPRASSEIQEIRRTPPLTSSVPGHPTRDIPSLLPISNEATWSATVGQLSPTPSLANETYNKFKGLSKRYSLPFPLFNFKSPGNKSVRSLPGTPIPNQ